MLVLGGFVLLAAILSFAAWRVLTTPQDVGTDGHSFTVERGMSVDEIFEQAVAEGLVASELGLYITYYLEFGSDNLNVKAGRYQFSGMITPQDFLHKLIRGELDHELLRVSVPEGVTRETIAETAAQTLPQFSAETFLATTSDKEGYLFPDTYLVAPDFTAEQLVDLMIETYQQRTAPLTSAIEAHQLDEYEILTLASILEREANSSTSMRMVSGILQNRLAVGMPLQADATIGYVLDKPLSDLTPSDLRIESPYNTYDNRGLSPTPIGNPGLAAITAVLDPTMSQNYYYITGNDGEFYYAETLAEHNQNIDRYLRE